MPNLRPVDAQPVLEGALLIQNFISKSLRDFTLRMRKVPLLIMAGTLMWMASSCQSLKENQSELENKASILETKILLLQEHLDHGEPELAIQTLRPMLQEYPDNPLVYNMAGLAYLSLHSYGRAKFYFESAYKLNKDSASGLNLSSVLIELQKYKEARQVLKAVLRDKNYSYQERVLHNYALSFEKEGRLRVAEKYYKKALLENPGYYLSRIQLGYLLKKQKKEVEAMESFRLAANFCKTCFEPVQELFYHHLFKNEAKKAAQLIDSFLTNKELSPESRVEGKKLKRLALQSLTHPTSIR
ncbi:MAG: hypothetical protein KA436_04440 [Oligoflexales bacterium]|nr:hypothetical protein [Oligoflexales bacterium]